MFYGFTGWLLLLFFVGRVRELEGLSGEWPFGGNQPFGQTPMAMGGAAWTWGSQSPLVVRRAGGLTLRLGLDLAYKKPRLHVKPHPNMTKYAMAYLPVLPPAASSGPRKQELLVFSVMDPSAVAWTSVCPVCVVSQ